MKETKQQASQTKQAKGPRPKRDKTVKKRIVVKTSTTSTNHLKPQKRGANVCDIVGFNHGVIAAFSQDFCNVWISGCFWE